MKANKKTMFAAALAIAVIALVGAGYAASVGHTATTVNSDNDASAVFTKAIQTGENAYTTAFDNTSVKFDTYTDAQNTSTPIYLLSDSTATGLNGYTGTSLGTATIAFTPASDATSYLFTANVLGGTLNGVAANGWTYILKITAGSADSVYLKKENGTDQWATGTTFTSISAQTNVTVELWIASSTLFKDVTTTVVYGASTGLTDYDNEASASVAPVSGTTIYEDLVIAFTFDGQA